MPNVNMAEATGGLRLKAGMLTQVDAPTSNLIAGFSKSGAELALPPVSGGALASDGVPTLPPPRAFDAMQLVEKFLSLKIKMANAQAAAGMEDVRHWGELQKQQNEKIARKISDAAEKVKEAKKSSNAMRIFGWIAVALTAVAAVATGGLLAFSAAAVAIATATLTETGVMDKMTQAIVKSLVKDRGMAQDRAELCAGIITVSIVIACSLATFGASAASGGLNATTSIAAKINSQIDKVMKIAKASQHLATVAKSGEAIAVGAGAEAGLITGVLQKQATDARAETLDIRQFLATLATLQGDEIARIQKLVLSMNTMTQRVVDAIDEQSRSASIVTRHIG
ncbi:type III secretion system translocon subunit SctE [Mesorhizobium sp. M0016]|uniref:type III secretion system translocon subunit SctE n=1 Tax=Mesorhizobium sp. M0016 TaxID=2956843 RepID=UPI00333DAD69